jgi:hypothetical protein
VPDFSSFGECQHASLSGIALGARKGSLENVAIHVDVKVGSHDWSWPFVRFEWATRQCAPHERSGRQRSEGDSEGYYRRPIGSIGNDGIDELHPIQRNWKREAGYAMKGAGAAGIVISIPAILILWRSSFWLLVCGGCSGERRLVQAEAVAPTSAATEAADASMDG